MRCLRTLARFPRPARLQPTSERSPSRYNPSYARSGFLIPGRCNALELMSIFARLRRGTSDLSEELPGLHHFFHSRCCCCCCFFLYKSLVLLASSDGSLDIELRLYHSFCTYEPVPGFGCNVTRVGKLELNGELFGAPARLGEPARLLARA